MCFVLVCGGLGKAQEAAVFQKLPFGFIRQSMSSFSELSSDVADDAADISAGPRVCCRLTCNLGVCRTGGSQDGLLAPPLP